VRYVIEPGTGKTHEPNCVDVVKMDPSDPLAVMTKSIEQASFRFNIHLFCCNKTYVPLQHDVKTLNARTKPAKIGQVPASGTATAATSTSPQAVHPSASLPSSAPSTPNKAPAVVSVANEPRPMRLQMMKKVSFTFGKGNHSLAFFCL